METAAINYRVADFLKRHPPFNAIDDRDLIDLAAHGRVRFYEPNEYLLWQGEPHRLQVFVIQQGTVSVWDESGDRSELRDVRGAGDMLGLERYNGARSCLYSARSESDVVIYGFPAEDFESLVLRHPAAQQYVAADAAVAPDYHAGSERRHAHRLFLHDLVARGTVRTCSMQDTLAVAASRLLEARGDALAVLDEAGRARGVMTAETLVRWVAAGGGSALQPVASVAGALPAIVARDASLTDGVLALAETGAEALAMTSDGTPHGTLQALVTPRDFVRPFGEQPALLFREIGRAAAARELRELNERARSFTLAHLTDAGAVEWLARFTHQIDAAVFARVVALAGAGTTGGCWCFCGSSGRGESLTKLAPHALLILDDGTDGAGAPAAREAALPHRAAALHAYGRVLELLADVGYLPRLDRPFESSFYVASVSEWISRFRGWVRDPIMQHMHKARVLFDLRPVLGPRGLWHEVEAAVADVVDGDFLRVLAHDCLANLPPLTFFHDAVVDRAGEHTAVFQLERTAVRPLVDVARVFALARGPALGRSTLDRLAAGRTLLPERDALFREAAETFKVVLWQQGRVGISQGTSGAELPPALLSRYDRHVLKSGFRSISRLLEIAADPAWLEAR